MSRVFDERIWYQIFKCPECGYKSQVTNVCRQCPATPADELATIPVYCGKHKTYHYVDGKPTMHRSVNMVPTEWATRYNPNLQRRERKKIKNLPKDAILR